MKKYVCIHGHFYQPPRENPWLEEIEIQDSAYPYHDWNERITAECYAPNTASRIMNGYGKIADIVNNYSKISFNFGPTLLSWLEKFSPETYQGILQADKISQERFSGHGSAMAQVYNHIIMPLASYQDKVTQVVWGIADFQKRFGRFPEGMWLAETAVDTETLEVLADKGIKFTVLAPRQAAKVREIGGDDWQDVSDTNVDTTRSYICNLPSGKTINLFFYNGDVSQGIAFGGLLDDGKNFAERLNNAFDEDNDQAQLVHIATDGESYGHHHKNGDMALSFCLNYIEMEGLADITNYGEFLEKFPPEYEAEIFENSSWSCGHGVERWRDNCGCNSGRAGWHQLWRKPLREALDNLRDDVTEIFEKNISEYVNDPWQTRNDYIEVILDRNRENVENFLQEHAKKDLSSEEKSKVLKLLEMERNQLLMYTSCGWFFDEISGIETVQIIDYAAKVIQIATEFSDEKVENDFKDLLSEIPGNIHENSLYIYENYVNPTKLDLLRVGVDYAMTSLFEEYIEDTKIGCYIAHKDNFVKKEAGRRKLATGKIKIISELTWQEEELVFAVIHLGDNNINGGVKKFESQEEMEKILNDINNTFDIGDITEVMNLINKHFENNTYTLGHIFRDQQRKILDQILKLSYDSVESAYREIYDNNYATMSFLKHLNIPIPKAIYKASEYVLNSELQRALKSNDIDFEKMENIINDIKKWGTSLDTDTIGYISGTKINYLLDEFSNQTNDIESLRIIEKTLSTVNSLGIKPRLWKAQNIYFSIAQDAYNSEMEKSEKGDQTSKEWVELFNNIGNLLRMDIS